jgi:hypothetical protein
MIHFDSQKLPKKFDTKTQHSSSQDYLQDLVLSSGNSETQAQKEALLDHNLLKKMAIGLQTQLVL